MTNATTENGLKTSKELVRIYVTGDCDGLPDMRDAFAAHPEVELVGWSAQVAEAAPTLTGGHLGVVLHATRAATLPVNELAAIREHTRAPGSCSGSSRTRRSTTSSRLQVSSTPRSWPATPPATLRASTSSRRRCAPRTRSS